MTQENEQRRRELIREYSKQAKPLNWAWRKVEMLQGFEGDRSERDYMELDGVGANNE